MCNIYIKWHIKLQYQVSLFVKYTKHINSVVSLQLFYSYIISVLNNNSYTTVESFLWFIKESPQDGFCPWLHTNGGWGNTAPPHTCNHPPVWSQWCCITASRMLCRLHKAHPNKLCRHEEESWESVSYHQAAGLRLVFARN